MTPVQIQELCKLSKPVVDAVIRQLHRDGRHEMAHELSRLLELWLRVELLRPEPHESLEEYRESE